jgi:hypothetical protein
MNNSSALNSNDFNRCDFLENIAKYCDKQFIFYPENQVKTAKVRDEIRVLFSFRIDY